MEHPCPKCGHCPTCGRSNVAPWHPWGYWPIYGPPFRYGHPFQTVGASPQTWTQGTSGSNSLAITAFMS